MIWLSEFFTGNFSDFLGRGDWFEFQDGVPMKWSLISELTGLDVQCLC